MEFWNANKRNIHKALHDIHNEEALLTKNLEEAERMEEILASLNQRLNNLGLDHEDQELKHIVDGLLDKSRHEADLAHEHLEEAVKDIEDLIRKKQVRKV